MVPVSASSYSAASTLLRQFIAEQCRRELSQVFASWLLRQTQPKNVICSIAAQAAMRVGADQDFETVAILGFAADAGILSPTELEALRRGLIRLAGREPVVGGVRMAFCADAVGILGVALGTRVIADPMVTGQVVRWATKFLKASHDRKGAEDWKRCLFAVADRQLGGTLALPLPESAATADVRFSLAATSLISIVNKDQVREYAAQALAVAVQELREDFTCEQAALRLAALERVTGASRTASDRKQQGGRHPKYRRIDAALQHAAESRPTTQEQVFEWLDAQKIVLPHAEPFMTARGWVAGFRRNPGAARAWLSKRWKQRNLQPFPRGRKNSK